MYSHGLPSCAVLLLIFLPELLHLLLLGMEHITAKSTEEGEMSVVGASHVVVPRGREGVE